METNERFAAFLFYVEDWLSSTAIDLMNAAEERGYLRLLLHAWKNPDCGLPNDDRALAQLSKLGRAWRAGSGAVVRAQFFENDGRLYNERLLRERENQIAVRQARSGAGKAGAESRWRSKRIAEPMAKAMANRKQTAWQNDASSSSILETQRHKQLGGCLEDEKHELLERCANDTLSEDGYRRLYAICLDEEIEDRLGGVDFGDVEPIGERLEAEILRRRALGESIDAETAARYLGITLPGGGSRNLQGPTL